MGEGPTEMTPASGPPTQVAATDDPAQIRAEIQQTRAEMAETIDAIQEKLDPQRLMEQAKDTVRDATVGKVKHMVTSATDTAADMAEQVQERAEDAVHYVRDNPVPAALVGAGVAWLLMRGRGQQMRPRPGARSAGVYRNAAGEQRFATPRVSSRDDLAATLANHPMPTALAGIGLGWWLLNRGGRARSGASASRLAGTEAGSQVRKTVDDVTEKVQESWQEYSGRVETEFERWMRENPLTVGAAAVALGAAMGLAAPRTETEDAWLGEARDTLVERAQDVAEGAVGQQAQRIVEGATEQLAGGASSP